MVVNGIIIFASITEGYGSFCPFFHNLSLSYSMIAPAGRIVRISNPTIPVTCSVDRTSTALPASWFEPQPLAFYQVPGRDYSTPVIQATCNQGYVASFSRRPSIILCQRANDQLGLPDQFLGIVRIYLFQMNHSTALAQYEIYDVLLHLLINLLYFLDGYFDFLGLAVFEFYAEKTLEQCPTKTPNKCPIQMIEYTPIICFSSQNKHLRFWLFHNFVPSIKEAQQNRYTEKVQESPAELNCID